MKTVSTPSTQPNHIPAVHGQNENSGGRKMAAFFFGAHVEFLQGSSLGNWRDRGMEFGNCEDPVKVMDV